jgi:hypothetical protein
MKMLPEKKRSRTGKKGFWLCQPPKSANICNMNTIKSIHSFLSASGIAWPARAFIMAVVVALGGSVAFASNVASDSTSSPAYSSAAASGTNFNGLNGGSGFGPWVILPNPIDTNYNDGGQFPGDGLSFEDNINTIPGSLFWAIYSDELASTDGVTATRTFTGGGLSVDQIFSTVIEFRSGDTGSYLGFELQDSNGVPLFNFYQQGNSPDEGFIVDGTGLHSGVNATYNYATPQTLGFVLTDPTNYCFTQNGVIIFSGSILGGDPITEVTYYTTNNNDGLYIQSLSVDPVTAWYSAWDSTGDPAYAAAEASGTNFNGLNGGSGFGPWVILPNPVDTNFDNGGQFPGNGLSVEDNINTFPGIYFWAIYSSLWSGNGGSGGPYGVTATRPFAVGGLGVDQIFTTEVEFRNGATGADLGFELQDSTGRSLFNFYQVGNSPDAGFIVDAAGLHSGVGANYDYQAGQSLSFELTSPTNYTFSQNGSPIFNGTITGGPITQVTYYSTNNQDGMYFQSVTISPSAIIPPSFTSGNGDSTPPRSATNFVNGQQRFTAVAYGTPPLAYQWSRSTDGVNYTNLVDGGEISGSSTSSLTLASVTTGDAASYVLTVTGPGGSSQAAVSSPATLTVITPSYTEGTDTIQLGWAICPDAPSTSPYTISANVTDWMYFQPTGTTLASYDADGPESFTTPASANGVANGNDSQSYLSFSGGAGAEASATGDRNFAFSGGEMSFTHTLFSTVETVNVWYVTYNDALDISVSSSGGGNPSYVLADYPLPYNYDGNGTGNNHGYGELTFLITGDVGDVITFSTTPDNGGVTGGGGGNGGVQAVTATAIGTGPAAIPPSFTNNLGNNTEPQAATMFVGGLQRFTAVAYGTGPLAYQWSRSTNGINYTNLVDGGEISGSSTASLTLASVTAGDAASYELTVTGPGGPSKAAVSAPVALTVLTGSYTGTDTVQLGSFICPNAPATNPYSISAHVTDWEYFQPTGVAGDGSTAAIGPHSFTQISSAFGGVNNGTDSQIYLSFTGGDGAEQIATNDENFSFSQYELSFAHTLFAPVETINVWYVTYNDALDISVSSSGTNSAPYSLGDYPLPYNPDGDGTGENHGYGEATYLITGAVGDVITFTTTPDSGGVSNGGNGNGGMQAVMATGIGTAPVGIPLFIAQSGEDTILSWQGVAGAAGMNLEFNDTLSPVGWSVVPVTPTYNGTNDSVTVLGTNTTQFYRLH